MREGNPIGAITVERPHPGPFPDQQIALLRTFADQAVIAIENARLVKELQARTTELTRSVGELTALGEVGQAVSSTLDLETVLRTIVSRATTLAGMDGRSIWEYDETREEFYLHATERLPDELVETLRATPIRKGEGALGRLAVTRDGRDPRHHGRAQLSEPGAGDSHPMRLSVGAGAAPARDHLLGALAEPQQRRRVRAGGDRAAQDLRDTSALAIRMRDCSRDRRKSGSGASQHKSEFRQHVARVAHAAQRHHRFLRGPVERMFGESTTSRRNTSPTSSNQDGICVPDQRHPRPLKIEAGRMELDRPIHCVRHRER
jgi:GAF domain-containing protein